MNGLLWILLGVGLCKLGIYLTKRSEACESIFMFSVLLVSAGMFIITLVDSVRTEPAFLENVLPFCSGLGIAFVFIGMVGLVGSVVYAIKCCLREV